jgi:hypothetical protein
MGKKLGEYDSVKFVFLWNPLTFDAYKVAVFRKFRNKKTKEFVWRVTKIDFFDKKKIKEQKIKLIRGKARTKFLRENGYKYDKNSATVKRRKR